MLLVIDLSYLVNSLEYIDDKRMLISRDLFLYGIWNFFIIRGFVLVKLYRFLMMIECVYFDLVVLILYGCLIF